MKRGFLVGISLLFLASFASGQDVLLEKRVFDLSRQLRCPVCTSESTADSNAEISVQMRETIQEQIIQGKTDAEILAFFQVRYGDWILLEPPKRGIHLLVWILPVIVGVAGVAALILVFRRWTRRSATPIDVADEDLKRVRDALERGDR